MTTDEEFQERRKYFFGGFLTGSLLGVGATILGGMMLRREVARILNRRLRNGLDPMSAEEEPEPPGPLEDSDSV